MARPQKRGRRKYFQFHLGNSERDDLVRRFIGESENASEAIKMLVADFMLGRMLYASDVVDVLRSELADVAINVVPESPQGSQGGEIDPNDQRLQTIIDALPIPGRRKG